MLLRFSQFLLVQNDSLKDAYEFLSSIFHVIVHLFIVIVHFLRGVLNMVIHVLIEYEN